MEHVRVTVKELVDSDEKLYNFVSGIVDMTNPEYSDKIDVIIFDSIQTANISKRAKGSYLNTVACFSLSKKENKIGVIIIFKDKLRKFIERSVYGSFVDLDGYRTIKDYEAILFLLFHECRHIQQYIYVLERYGVDIALKLNFVDRTLYFSKYPILEQDANKYAFKQTFGKDLIKTKVNTLDLGKVFGYIFNTARDLRYLNNVKYNIEYVK